MFARSGYSVADFSLCHVTKYARTANRMFSCNAGFILLAVLNTCTLNKSYAPLNLQIFGQSLNHVSFGSHCSILLPLSSRHAMHGMHRLAEHDAIDYMLKAAITYKQCYLLHSRCYGDTSVFTRGIRIYANGPAPLEYL